MRKQRDEVTDAGVSLVNEIVLQSDYDTDATSSKSALWAIPTTWIWTDFGDAVEIASNLKSPETLKDLPHIAPDNISAGKGELLGYRTVGEDKVISPKHLFRSGQVLFSKIRPYLKKAVYVDFVGACSADMYPLDVRTITNPEYLKFWLISDDFVKFVEKVQGRTLLPKVNQDGLNRTPFPLPPLPEQRRIVAKLDALSARSKRAKAELERVEALAARAKQAVLEAAFTGELTKEWRSRNQSPQTGEQLRAELTARWAACYLKKNSKSLDFSSADALDILPESWTWIPVAGLSSKVVDGVHAKPNYQETGIPFLTVRNLTAGHEIDFSECKYISEEDHLRFVARTRPEYGDILISKDGTLGVARAIRTARDFSIFVSVALVKVLDKSQTDYLELAFQSPLLQKQFVGVGSGLQHIHLVDLRQDMVPIAPPAERELIVRLVRGALAKIERIRLEALRASELLGRLDQSILSCAFRGELVPQDPADEPASVLLDRIRAERAGSGAAPKRRGRRPAA